MKTIALLATLALASCEGLSLSTTPDGQIVGSYKPPVIQSTK